MKETIDETLRKISKELYLIREGKVFYRNRYIRDGDHFSVIRERFVKSK